MSIDINALSADELFELARKKRLLEKEAEARKAAVAELRERRNRLTEEHSRALEAIDREIRELHQRRGELAIRYKQAVDAIDREIAVASREPEAAPPPAAPATKTPSAQADLAGAVLALLKARREMSESLLKERLRAQGFDTSRLARQLEQLLRERKIVNRGGGNYAYRSR